MKKLSFLLLAGALLAGCGNMTIKPDTAEETSTFSKATEQGKLALSDADMEKALGSFELALEEEPDDATTKKYVRQLEKAVKVKQLLNDDEYDKAIKKAQEVLATDGLVKGVATQVEQLKDKAEVFHSADEIDDISSLDEYNTCKNAGLSEEETLKVIGRFSRDNARTPMQWDASYEAGFTTGTPWLPVNPNYTAINVASQINEGNSVLSYYKKLIQLRKNPDYKEAVVYGELIPYLREQKNLMAFYRKGEEKTLLVLTNYQNEEQKVDLPTSSYRILNNYEDVQEEDCSILMHGYQALVLELY